MNANTFLNNFRKAHDIMLDNKDLTEIAQSEEFVLLANFFTSKTKQDEVEYALQFVFDMMVDLEFESEWRMYDISFEDFAITMKELKYRDCDILYKHFESYFLFHKTDITLKRRIYESENSQESALVALETIKDIKEEAEEYDRIALKNFALAIEEYLNHILSNLIL